MSLIRILTEDVSNRIAAGEVIERPASIVKELAENSLDAGATRIAITVERGGRSLIRVVDDGSGMDAEDALLCLEAHATSKIRTAEDIEDIRTLGFRGEALPSIAAVSRFTLRTQPPEASEGAELIASGGVISNVNRVGLAPGTSIEVRNLFFNMPARRKFLRSVATEEGHIQEMALLLALAHPEVGIELTFDKRPVLAVQPNQDLRTRAAMLLGRDTMAAMLELKHEEEEIGVSGFVARPGFTRSSRRDQRVFVNGRPVANQTIGFAVRDAYHTLVMKGRYPPVLLFLELAADRVDINVHPAKREVRFRDTRTVGRIVGTAVRNALQRTALASTAPRDNDDPAHAVEIPPPQPSIEQFLPGAGTAPGPPAGVDVPPPLAPPAEQPGLPLPQASLLAAASEAPELATNEIPSPVAPKDQRPAGTAVSAANRQEIRSLRVLGPLGDAYVLAEGRNGLVLIDQHAAHERVMFEKILKQARERDGASQGLLIPVTLEVSGPDARLLQKYNEDLAKLGFELEHFGGSTFIIRAIPPQFPQENIVGILNDILDELRDAPLRNRRADEHLIAQSACRAAVKACDKLTTIEVEKLLAELVETELPYTCPHGRPTMIEISYAELEKRFGRRAP